GAKWPGIFPLRIHSSIAFVDRDPPSFARRNSRSLIRFLKPRDNPRRFGAMAVPGFVVVRQRAVKRILPRREFCRNVVAPTRRIRIVKSAVTLRPIFVPRARAIRHRIVLAW